MIYPENDYRDYLEHSAKGTHWKKGHKYDYIDANGNYVYGSKKGRGGSTHGGSGRTFGESSANVTRSGGGSSPSIQPASLKSKPGSTSGVDKKKKDGTTNTFAGRPRGRDVYYGFEKKSSSKKWKAKTGSVKKGKKLGLKKKFGSIAARPLY